jgi:hypothetical protein
MSSQRYVFFLTRSALPYKREFIQYAFDRRGWTGNGFAFSLAEKEKDANVFIHFKSNAEMEELFGNVPSFKDDLKGLSITDSTDAPHNIKIYFNVENWKTPPNVFTVVQDGKNTMEGNQRLKIYRQYLVQHEVGHAIGYDHPEKLEYAETCFPCHPMQQQTKGTSMCKANPWISEIKQNPSK